MDHPRHTVREWSRFQFLKITDKIPFWWECDRRTCEWWEWTSRAEELLVQAKIERIVGGK